MAADRRIPSGEMERLAALGHVMGQLTHDLANEVTLLQGWAQLARGELEAGRAPAAELERVLNASEALGRMLHDVVGTVAGQGLSAEVRFEPAALAEETIRRQVPALSSITVRLAVDIPAGVEVAGRSSFFTRSLSNLVNNAARHARHEVLVRLRVEGREVVMRVEDDGPGIEPADQPVVFRPFWRGEKGQTGLGLSSVLWAVGQLGGEVEYRDDSSLGGAAFEIRLSVAGPIVQRQEPRVEAEPDVGLSDARIVLVDDDGALRSVLTRLLRRAGADVHEVDPQGEPEEELLHSIVSLLPEVILLDLRLGGRDGMLLWQRMAEIVPRLASRVVFVSGAGPGDPEWEAAVATGQPVLMKPFEFPLLARTIRTLRGESV